MSRDLARELVARPEWEWRAGMVVLLDGETRAVVIYVTDKHVSVVLLEDSACLEAGDISYIGTDDFPDLTDGPTCGALLEMLLDVPGITRIETWHHETGAAVRFDQDDLAPDEAMSWIHADTLGEALARALLAVWGDAAAWGGDHG